MLASASALLLALAQAATAVAPGQVEVAGTEFFAIDTRTDPPVIVPSATIPYRPETSCFGWVIRVAPRKGEARLREELRLPAPAPNWGTDAETRVHRDRAGATRLFSDDLSDGMVTSEWCISEGDPAGAHHIEVFSGDRLLHRFEFTVIGEPQRI